VYSVVLRTQGRLEEARAESEQARQLDPTSLAINHTLAFNFVATREYGRAIEQMKKTLELDPSFQLPRIVLALVYAVQGRHGEAVAELKKLGPASELPASYAGSVGGINGMAGRRAEALRILAELEERSKLEYVPASARALIYIGLRDKDRAFAWLDKAYAERDWRLRELKVSPRFDSLRSDPRFTRLLKQMHLQ